MTTSTDRCAAFFDLDKTVIAKSSTLAFSRPFFDGGLINRRSVLRSAYAQFVFALQGADSDQMDKMRAYLTELCAGWDVQVVRDIVAETLHTIVEPLVYEEAVQLIAEHQQEGRDVVIVSASGSEVVEPIASMLGADATIATELVAEEGRYTGEIAYYAYAENKAAAMRDMATANGYDLEGSYAYSDSETDVPMLGVVGHPYAVNPDKALRRIAAQNEWPILRFARPVALRRRVPLDSTPTRIAAAVTVGIVTVGILTSRLRRRRRPSREWGRVLAGRL